MSVLNSCLFCVKPISNNDRKPDAINKMRQFFVMFQRQTNNQLSAPFDGMLLKTKRLLCLIEKDVDICPCEECLGILETYNTLYEQMKKIELQTICVLDKLGNTIKQADEAPEKVFQLSNPTNHSEDVKPTTTIDILTGFRTVLQQTCMDQSRKQFPKVALRRMKVGKPTTKVEADVNYYDMLNHVQTATVNALAQIFTEMMTLNIIFQLAVLPVDNFGIDVVQQEQNVIEIEELGYSNQRTIAVVDEIVPMNDEVSNQAVGASASEGLTYSGNSKKRSEKLKRRKCDASIKSFKCEISENGFGLKSSLEQPIKSHTGTKKYTCQFCNQKFRRKASQKAHMKIHASENPHKCSKSQSHMV